MELDGVPNSLTLNSHQLTVHEERMGADSFDEGRGSDEESLHLHLSSSDEDDNATPVGLETDN